MTSDLQALLAAVVADPADDVARLVYADCLEESGNAARAAFIRVQIEAERHHPDSHTRAALEGEAHALFEQHWVGWWGEVCSAVGMPAPVPKPTAGLRSLAKRMGLGREPVSPYSVSGFRIVATNGPSAIRSVAVFRRGFPDSAESHPTWTRVSPLQSLLLFANSRTRVDGPHLAGVQNVQMWGHNLAVLNQLFRSPHLERLESIRLEQNGDPHEYEYLTTRFADDLAQTLTAPRVRHLKRLAIHLWDDRAVEALATAQSLSGLEALEVSVQNDGDREAVALLARSPHFAGLKELTVRGGIGARGIEALVRNPTWTGLRKLDISTREWSPDVFADADALPELVELRLSDFDYSAHELAALRRSPLLKQLRHFAVSSGWEAADFEIADAVDPDRIETFAIGRSPPRVVMMLRERFGNKLRHLPG